MPLARSVCDFYAFTPHWGARAVDLVHLRDILRTGFALGYGDSDRAGERAVP